MTELAFVIKYRQRKLFEYFGCVFVFTSHVMVFFCTGALVIGLSQNSYLSSLAFMGGASYFIWKNTLSWFHDDTLPPPRFPYQPLPLLPLQSLYPNCFMRSLSNNHEKPPIIMGLQIKPLHTTLGIYMGITLSICPSVHLSVGLSRVNLSFAIIVQI